MYYEKITVGLCDNNNVSITFDDDTGEFNAKFSLKYSSSAVNQLLDALREQDMLPVYYIENEYKNMDCKVWKPKQGTIVLCPCGGRSSESMRCTLPLLRATERYNRFFTKAYYVFNDVNVINVCYGDTDLLTVTYSSVTVDPRGGFSAIEN